jgi:hypothetical protein
MIKRFFKSQMVQYFGTEGVSIFITVDASMGFDMFRGTRGRKAAVPCMSLVVAHRGARRTMPVVFIHYPYSNPHPSQMGRV